MKTMHGKQLVLHASENKQADFLHIFHWEVKDTYCMAVLDQGLFLVQGRFPN